MINFLFYLAVKYNKIIDIASIVVQFLYIYILFIIVHPYIASFCVPLFY